MKTKIFLTLILTFCFSFAGEVFGQCDMSELKTATLQSRQKIDDKDNYVDAAYSFEKGVNGESGLKITRNDWDVYFYAIRNRDGDAVRDYFDVTMVTDDRSRIQDLGELLWTDSFKVPELPAYEKLTREKFAEAKVGHIYLVHTKDRDSDLYALFRVEELKSGENVTITWKLIPAPQ